MSPTLSLTAALFFFEFIPARTSYPRPSELNHETREPLPYIVSSFILGAWPMFVRLDWPISFGL